MKKKRNQCKVNVHWYVEVNSYTNKPVSEYLTSIGKGSENCYTAISDEHGSIRQVWEVPREFIHLLEESRLNDPNISFLVYTRPETAKTISIWPFSRLSRDKKTEFRSSGDPVVIDAETQLKNALKNKYRKPRRKKPTNS